MYVRVIKTLPVSRFTLTEWLTIDKLYQLYIRKLNDITEQQLAFSVIKILEIKTIWRVKKFIEQKWAKIRLLDWNREI